jgi:uncharacterized protein (DUF2141 family)
VTPTSQVRVRFIARDLGAGSIVEAGVDDLKITNVDCTANIVGDMNGDGVVDSADLGILLSSWGTSNALADLDGNGTVDSADLGILLSAWS